MTPRQRLFFGAPTRDQAKRIAWNDLKDLTPKFLLKNRPSESDLRIELQNGSEIWVLGFDDPRRFEGAVWHGGILDEYADMDEAVWKESVEPALRDTGGWCWFTGVPAGRNHYYELSLRAREGRLGWGDYCWLSSDAMDPAEVAEARQGLDERTYRQEYEGSFESYEGRAYVYFDTNVHRVIRPFDDKLPVCICLDFNLDPFLVEFAQDRYPLPGGLGTYFFDEIRYPQADIWKVCDAIKRKLDARLDSRATSHRLIFYGDYTGSSRRDVSATHSSWEIVRNCFTGYNTDFRLRSNPRIVDRVNAFNSRLRSADGTVRVQFHPNCVELMKDLDQVDMEMLTTKKGQAGDRTHSSDAAGYFMNYEYSVSGGNVGRIVK